MDIDVLPDWCRGPEIDHILKGRLIRLNDNKKSGDKYLRNIVLKHVKGYKEGVAYGKVDVYAVLEAFGVTCPAVAHAVKKLLCPGTRGGKDTKQDIQEARDAIDRALEIEEARMVLVDILPPKNPKDSF